MVKYFSGIFKKSSKVRTFDNKYHRINSADGFLFFALIICVIWGTGWYFIDCLIPDVTERGVFGDKFGAINSLFSGLALAGLIATLLLQKEALRKQHDEFEDVLKTQRIQNFENTFFNMLTLQQEIVKNLSFEDEVKGRNIFEPLYKRVIVRYQTKEYIGIKDAIKELGIKSFSKITEVTCLDHYFRHLYRIFKFVYDNHFLSEEEKYNYSSIIRSQLSDFELVILFYNCLSDNGCEKFKPLIEEYAVFNNLRFELLVDENDIMCYADGAYNYIKRLKN